MKIFYTSSAKHLISKLPKGKFLIKRFSDQEIYLKIQENVAGKNVCVLGSTFPPAENILELFFLLDALKREKAKIHLIVPYFGYARQDQIKKGEAFSGKILSEWFRDFQLKRIDILSMHSNKLKEYFDYENSIPMGHYLSVAKKADILIAPDKGALPLTKAISKALSLPIISMEKVRPYHEKAHVKLFDGQVFGKKVLIIEDMIVTGGTILEATKLLLRKKAKEVSVIATHGIFSSDAIAKIEKSPIHKVYITNSIPQKNCISKIKVFNLSSWIASLLKKQ